MQPPRAEGRGNHNPLYPPYLKGDIEGKNPYVGEISPLRIRGARGVTNGCSLEGHITPEGRDSFVSREGGTGQNSLALLEQKC